MTIAVKHNFESAVTDSADDTLIQPSHWNDSHALTLASGKLVGRVTAGAGAAEEITLDPDGTLAGNSDSAVPTQKAVKAALAKSMAAHTYKGNNTGSSAAPADISTANVLADLLSAGAYGKTNVLGTVSQSSGVPTGAIVETGTNSNGTYTKFADGTMICFSAATSTSITINSAYGSLFISSNIAWTFPAVFASPPVAFNSARYGAQANWSAPGSVTTTAMNYVLMDAVSRASGTTVILPTAAIGRWF